jgi:protein involved in polysaccharide export with SLBB domain
MMRWGRIGARLRACGGALVLAGAAGAVLPAQAQSPAAEPPNSLRPGDAVRLRIWREPDLSGDFPVDESGVVVFPKIGALRVTSEDPVRLKAHLTRSYATYLTNPSIEVQVLRRVQVLGAVDKPGLYAVDPTMTVADAIALAGGVTSRGKENTLELRRNGEKVSGNLSGRVMIGQSSIRSGDQLYVPERSWASRNPGVIVGVAGLLSTIVWRIAQ